jgi:hypothetical protein
MDDTTGQPIGCQRNTFDSAPADLFSDSSRLLVRIERAGEQPCCAGLNTIHIAKPPHAGELRCAHCNRHRGWLPKEAHSFVAKTIELFGVPAEPISFRIPAGHPDEEESMTDRQYDNSNSGVLFRVEDKKSDKHADFSGSCNCAGQDYWIDGYVRTSNAGKKFISFKLKAKDGAAKAQTGDGML